MEINNDILTEKDDSLLSSLLKKLYLNKIDSIDIMNKIKDVNFDYANSSINRYNKIINIFNNINFLKTNTVCTVLKINRNDEVINYAYVYGNIQDSKIINEYVLTSNSLISKDGEYKHRLIEFNKIKYKSQLYNNIYDYIVKDIKNNEYKLTYEIFNISDDKIKNKYTKELKNNPVLINVYIISWLVELYNTYYKNQEINMNENYNKIVFSNKDIIKFTELYEKNKLEIDDLIKQYIYFSYNTYNKLEIGQKLLPFNYIQLKEYNNIIHFQWKEILINKIITNILYNINSPSFSIFYDWIFISNSNKDLYDNKEIYQKILYSDQIKSILLLLNKANSGFIEINNNQRNEFIDSLIRKLKKIIQISENKMLMSNISLCYFSEYSGKTIYDYYNKIIDNKKINNKIGNLFEDYDIFEKYIFEIVYSLYCLNLRGIIHGDLHLNNITLNVKNNNIKDNSYVVYDLNNEINNNILKYFNNEFVKDKSVKKESEELVYVFEHKGTYPCIIDYSRSYVLLKLIHENIIEKEKNKIREKFIKSERNRIINELKGIFPNFMKNNAHKIKFLFLNKNFDILFIYFSAFDIFKFATNLLIFIKKASTINNINVNDKIINLLTDISKKAYSYLEKIIDENTYNTEINHTFPNYNIILEFFPNNKFDIKLKNKLNKNTNIIDIFSINRIDNHYTINKMIKEINSNIKDNLENKDYDTKTKKEILNKLKNFINFKPANSDLDIEQLINTEYYNIKSNLSLLTESINTGNITYDNTMSISNF